MTESYICICSHCGAKNRIPENKMEGSAKCGRCHEVFIPQACHKEAVVILTLRCGQCRTKNRVPLSKLKAGAQCGRCAAALEHQDVYTGRTVMVTDANFSQTVLNSPLPVLLYAWGPSCSVCSRTGPEIEQMAAKTKGKIRVAKVNIEANPQIAGRYHILSVPNFFIFENGKLIEQVPGAVSGHALMMKMAHFV